jgi:hypothetical protein
MSKFKDPRILTRLVKHKKADFPVPVWYWINPMTGAKLSPDFFTKEEADNWFEIIVVSHNETYELMGRTKDGKMFELKCRIPEDALRDKKCPYRYEIDGNVLSIIILGVNEDDAKNRVEEYFKVISWIE